MTDAVGYRFHYDEESKQFAHPGTLVLLQPNGHVSRYLYGLEYPPNDVRLGLLEASQGKLISTVEQVMLFCYRYDAHEGRYVVHGRTASCRSARAASMRARARR